MINSHIHLDFDNVKYPSNSTTGAIIPSTGKDNWDNVIACCNSNKNSYFALGIHPWFVKEHQMIDIYNLEVKIDGGQAVIRFGPSFTLRLDEDGVNQLTDVLADTLGCLRTVRREYTQSAEDQMVQAGIDAREAVKQKKLSPSQKGKDWDPTDPVNW